MNSAFSTSGSIDSNLIAALGVKGLVNTNYAIQSRIISSCLHEIHGLGSYLLLFKARSGGFNIKYVAA